MKKFKSIQEWLSTNPDKEEQNKVLLLIQRGSTSKIRREVWEKERYLLKLQSFANHCKKLEFDVPKDHLDALAKTKKEIEILKKDLPVIPKKEKKEYKELETKTEVLADTSEK